MSAGPDADTGLMTTPTSPRLHRWGRATAVPLTVLAVVFALTYVTQLASGRDDVGEAARWTRVVVWVAFAVDYVVRVRLSGNAVRFVLSHPVDLVVVVVPLLRPLTDWLGSLVRRRRSLQGHRNVVRRTLVYLLSVATTLVLFVSAAVLLAERDAPGATILTFSDALWWAAVTVTTVGYGDLYPVTTAGRGAAVLGMLLGIGVLGTVTATISAQVVAAVRAEVTPRRADEGGPVDEGPAEDEAIALVDLPQVLQEVRDLRREIAALRTASLRADVPVPPAPAGPAAPTVPDPPAPPDPPDPTRT